MTSDYPIDICKVIGLSTITTSDYPIGKNDFTYTNGVIRSRKYTNGI
jgi:hypothetical protein